MIKAWAVMSMMGEVIGTPFSSEELAQMAIDSGGPGAELMFSISEIDYNDERGGTEEEISAIMEELNSIWDAKNVVNFRANFMPSFYSQTLLERYETIKRLLNIDHNELKDIDTDF